MKNLKPIIFLSSFLLVFAGCDKDFEKINTNPYEINEIDLGLLFAGVQRIGVSGNWERQNTIVQHFVNPFNLGATKFFNWNYDDRGNGLWSLYTDAAQEFGHILDEINEMPEEDQVNYVNLKNIVRIWKANVFMNIVDNFGNVPYFDALKAYSGGAEYYYPKYDDAQLIYADLEKEIREALAALDPQGDFVSADLFYGKNGSVPSNDAATQVAKWKKVGNSLLLRMGMRYSRVNQDKAKTLVAEAVNGGVMSSSADDVFVTYNGTFTNGRNNLIVTNNAHYYYAAEPFVNHLKSTNDPRTRYLIARFSNPGSPEQDPSPKLNIEEQYGIPVGVTTVELSDITKYRGPNGTGFDYSQMNTQGAVARVARTYWLTYSQTSLLLAEAAFRGWISGDAKEYYENAINADMDRYALYVQDAKQFNIPKTSISQEEKAAYLAHPKVAYDEEKALELINTQYWVVNIFDGEEAWNNFKRSGYPVLQRNTSDDVLFANDGSFGDGFPRRFRYPTGEETRNALNYSNAVNVIGSDDNRVRIFWDPK